MSSDIKVVYDNIETVSLQDLIEAKNWQAQYRLITDWGKLILPKPELQQDAYLLKGCETSAWLAHEKIQDRHQFSFDSQSRVMNGLVAIVLSELHNKTSDELSQIDVVRLLISAGLEKHLTPSRNKGLKTIIARMYLLADVTCNA